MDARRYLTCLWPGLSELWYRGRPSGLPAALAFAAALNFLLVARFLYPEWLTPLLVKIACWTAALVWAVSVARAVRELQAIVDPRAASDRADRFGEAHAQYLRGHWIDAESLLTECLDVESRDPPALLLLAGIYRHTGRPEAAAAALDQLDRMEAAQGWWLERRAERARLARSLGVAAEQSRDDEKDSGQEAVDDDGGDAIAAAPVATAMAAVPGSSSIASETDPPTDSVAAEAADQLIAAEMADSRNQGR